MVPENAAVTLSNAWEMTTGLVTWTSLVALIMSSFSGVMGQKPDRNEFERGHGTGISKGAIVSGPGHQNQTDPMTQFQPQL